MFAISSRVLNLTFLAKLATVLITASPFRGVPRGWCSSLEGSTSCTTEKSLPSRSEYQPSGARLNNETTTTTPATTPSVQTLIFTNKPAGIQFHYPSTWTSQRKTTSLFEVSAPLADPGCASLSLDVPTLPGFIPAGMLTPGMVEGGYVKDLKKNHIHDAKVDESIAVKLVGCSARRVKCSGHENGKIAIDVAVVIVHSSRVYIFSCDSDDVGYSSARAALDLAVASTEWIK